MKSKDVTVDLREEASSFAEDKDIARELRCKVVLPALERRKRIILKFGGVELSTQSFIHALISEPIRKYGDYGLRLMEFKDCKPAIKSIIRNVVSYSLEYATVDPSIGAIQADEIPQADDLGKVRKVLEELTGATDIASLAERTGFARRHINYRLSAARILGLLDPASGEVTARTKELLESEIASMQEREILREAVTESKFARMLVPDLFEPHPPNRHAIARRIRKAVSLSQTTAMRRAGTILSWRRQLGGSQMSLDLRIP